MPDSSAEPLFNSSEEERDRSESWVAPTRRAGDGTPGPIPLSSVTPARAWSAEGARVAIATCLQCGASLLLDPSLDFDVVARHADWHEAHDEGWVNDE
jgi:hypothetical protein